MFIDSHCHLHFKDYDKDRERVVKRAVGRGVGKVIEIGTNVKSSRKALEVSEKYSNLLLPAVGIHPEETGRKHGQEGEEEEEEVNLSLEALAKKDEYEVKGLRDLIDENREKIVAIGECGIDYYWHRKSEKLSEEEFVYIKKAQRRLFEEQVKLASDFDLPLIIHSRDFQNDEAFKDIYDIIVKVLGKKPKIQFIFHSFTGPKGFLNIILEMGGYIGFNGIITYKNADNVRELCYLTPVDRILSETDAPLLAPERERGDRNEPGNVVEVVKKIGEVKGEDMEGVIEENFDSTFVR